MPENFLERNCNCELACTAIRGLVQEEGNRITRQNKAVIKAYGFALLYISFYPPEKY